jgi:molecular chaperone HtpG
MIDNHFIQFMESKNKDLKFERVDSDITENLLEHDPSKKIVTGEDSQSKEEKIEKMFKDHLAIKGLHIRVETLKDESVPGMILLNEQQRRFKEMTRMMGQGSEMPDLFADHTLMVNTASPAIAKVLALADDNNTETANMLIDQIYDLAMLSHQAISKERMAGFMERSGKLLGMI